MRFGIKTLLIVTIVGALVALVLAPPSPLTLSTLPYAEPSDVLRKLTPTYRASEWLFETDSRFNVDETVEDFLGQEYSRVKIARDHQGEIVRELVVDVGTNDKQDLRATAALMDSLAPFEELRELKSVGQLDAVFGKSKRGSIEHVDFEEFHAVQYWGGFVIEGENIRVVLVTACVAKNGEDDWELFQRDIRESVFVPKW